MSTTGIARKLRPHITYSVLLELQPEGDGEVEQTRKCEKRKDKTIEWKERVQLKVSTSLWRSQTAFAASYFALWCSGERSLFFWHCLVLVLQVYNYEIQNLKLSVLGHGLVGGQYTIATHLIRLMDIGAISRPAIRAVQRRKSFCGLVNNSPDSPSFAAMTVPLSQVMWKSKEALPSAIPKLNLQLAWVRVRSHMNLHALIFFFFKGKERPSKMVMLLIYAGSRPPFQTALCITC